MTSAELLPQIFNLSYAEQREIAEAIRDHLGDHYTPIEKSKFDAELLRRARDADEHPEEGTPLDVVIDRLKRKR
jgi:putative addiction module component (TIGR02574 family)